MQLKVISVVNYFPVYQRVVWDNLNLAGAEFFGYDNSRENIGIAVRYNDFIEKNLENEEEDSWCIFCHQDFGFEEDPGPKLAELSPDCIYGAIGVNIKLKLSLKPFKLYRKKETEGQFKQGHNNDDFEFIGNYLERPKKVLACDCCCLIVHSSLIKKYNLRFDPKCEFHLYAEDFQINARKKFGVKTMAVQFACYHLGIGNYDDPAFYKTLDYLKKKHHLRKLYSTNPYC
jgi:hypothetical protein